MPNRGRGLGIIVVAALLLGFGLVLNSTITATPDPAPPDRRNAPTLATPCGGAKSTFDEARAAMPFPLEQPDVLSADPGSLKSVWLCNGESTMLVYDSGVAVMEGTNDLADPAAEWNDLAEEYEEFDSGTIAGTPASFAIPGVNGAIGLVDFVVDDVRVSVTGNGEIALEELIAVGESVHDAFPRASGSATG
jgi:hypothetical protein